MPVDTPSFFAQVIQDHLELKRKNAELEPEMPITRYTDDDPFGNHPLFKTEEQARLEETSEDLRAADSDFMTWLNDEPVEAYSVSEPEDSLWSRSRDFDWGD